MNKVTQLQPVPDVPPMVIDLSESPINRYGFKYIGPHFVFKKQWEWNVEDLYLGAATVAKLCDVYRSHEGFPLANANILSAIKENLYKIPQSWIGREIYILGTTFTNVGQDEHVVSFHIAIDKDEKRELVITPRAFLQGIEEKSRILLHRE